MFIIIFLLSLEDLNLNQDYTDSLESVALCEPIISVSSEPELSLNPHRGRHLVRLRRVVANALARAKQKVSIDGAEHFIQDCLHSYMGFARDQALIMVSRADTSIHVSNTCYNFKVIGSVSKVMNTS